MSKETKKSKPIHKNCNCSVCMVTEIRNNLLEVINLDWTYGEDKGRFIYFLLKACLGAIKNDGLEDMLDRIEEVDVAMHNYFVCLGEVNGFIPVKSKSKKSKKEGNINE